MSEQTGAWRPEERNAQQALDDGVEINSQTQHSQSNEYQEHKENPQSRQNPERADGSCSDGKGLCVALPAMQEGEHRHCVTENDGLAL